MPDLYASVLGSPFRAAIAQAGGERAFVRIGERSDDDFALSPHVWLDADGSAVGAPAALLEHNGHAGEFHRVRVGDTTPDERDPRWEDRDLLAVLLKKLMDAAALQAGETMQRLVCVVPGGLAPELQSACAQAALLAGAPAVELVTPDQLMLLTLRGSSVPGIGITLEAWDDVTRMTIVDTAQNAEAPLRIIDVTKQLSRARLRELLFEKFGLTAERTSGLQIELADRLFDTWISGKDVTHGIGVTRALARGAPLVAFGPAEVFAALENFIAERFEKLFQTNDIEPGRIRSIAVLGSWTRPVAKALRARVPGGAAIKDERGVELDGAIKLFPPQAHAPKPALSSEILAVAESARTLRALSQGAPITLLRPGARLPATSVSENFKSSSFIGKFMIAASGNDEVTPLMALTIPRYGERQATSYLRAVVHCETPRFILLEVAYLYSTQRRFTFYDKSAKAAIPVSDHVFRVVRA